MSAMKRSFTAPYLTLMTEDAPQREHSLREVFNALRWIVRSGSPWRLLPNDFPPWEAVYQQSRRWLDAGCFEAMVRDLRSMVRCALGRTGQPRAVVLDGRTLQSSCESGPRSGYDGYKRKKGSKVHRAVETPGHLLAVHMTPANEQERAQVLELCEAVRPPQDTTSNSHGPTRATRQSNRARTPKRRVSSCRSSSWQRQRRALCCCPGAGWSSAALPGRRAFDDCPDTTSSCPTYSEDCTLWCSPLLCCPRQCRF